MNVDSYVLKTPIIATKVPEDPNLWPEIAKWCKGKVVRVGIRVEDRVANPGDYIVHGRLYFFVVNNYIFEAKYCKQ